MTSYSPKSHAANPPEEPFERLLSAHKSGDLVIQLARSNEDLEAIQRLRYRVFTEEMHAILPEAVDGLDCDRFDSWCQHLMVKDLSSGRIAGTYRLLTPDNAKHAGGYYAAQEFDLSGLGAIADQFVEIGRSCTHPDYRDGSVILMLWSGLIELMKHGGFRYMLGCASVSLLDDGATAACVWRGARDTWRTHPEHVRVVPLNRYPVEKLDRPLPARVPPLIKGYLNIGAKICGDPAWDPDFNTADFPVLLDLHAMDPRYRKHFGLV